MDSEYKVGAVADIIARLSQNQHDPDSTYSENESTPMKKKKGKKRKLDFSNPGDIKENGINNKDGIKAKKKKIKTLKDTSDESILGNKTISNKIKKIETKETKNKNKQLKKTNKGLSQNEVNESSDLKVKKRTPPSKDLLNGSEQQSEQPKLNEKQNTSKKAKQLKKKIKSKQNKIKKNISTNLTKQDDEENKQLETQESVKKTKGKKGKKQKTSSEPPSTTPSETVKEIPQNAEKETCAQKGENGFPKHVANGSEEQYEEPKLNEEQESRTVFVGNLPLKISRHKVTNMFKQYGEVETVRYRSVPVADINIPRNACIKMNNIHEKRTNMNAYVRFKNIESVEKALEMNGIVVNEHTIRVDTALKQPKANSHSIFIGNLPFEAEEEELRKAFQTCGEIDNVRIIRDQKTNTGKGFGYVNFKSADGVAFAMEMENVKIRNREVRVKRSYDRKPSKSGRFNDSQQSSKSGRFNDSQFKSKFINAGGLRPAKSKSERFGRFDGGGNFRGNNPNSRADKGFNRRNDNTRSNDAGGFKNRDNRFNKKETSGGGVFKKKFDKDKTSFQGSTVHEKGNKNNQKKKLSYDALKKFIIAKKLTQGSEKKKGFNFLTK
uniref:RNA-binding protein 34 n=1 Tax=Cacopsylla melanoneura TaxID=428564 RepID=A0A8D8QFU1_9HEMI